MADDVVVMEDVGVPCILPRSPQVLPEQVPSTPPAAQVHSVDDFESRDVFGGMAKSRGKGKHMSTSPVHVLVVDSPACQELHRAGVHLPPLVEAFLREHYAEFASQTRRRLSSGAVQITCIHRKKKCPWAMFVLCSSDPADCTKMVVNIHAGADHDATCHRASSRIWKGLPHSTRKFLEAYTSNSGNLPNPGLLVLAVATEVIHDSAMLADLAKTDLMSVDDANGHMLLKSKCRSWYNYQKSKSRKIMQRNEVSALETWMRLRQPDRTMSIEDIFKDPRKKHCVICLTRPEDAFNAEVDLGLSVTLSTPYLLSLLRNCKSLCFDTTYKLSTNNINLFIMGLTDCYGMFIPACFTFSSRQTSAALSKALKEPDTYLLQTYQEKLTPLELVHDNDDASFKQGEAGYGPSHWPDLITRGRLIHVNCGVHMLRRFTDATGRAKFDKGLNKVLSLENMKVKELRAELATFGPIGGGTSVTKAKLKEMLAQRRPPPLPAANPAVLPSMFDMHNKQFMVDLKKIMFLVQRKDQVVVAFALFKAKWEPIMPAVVQNLESEYWGHKSIWQRCACLLNNNNPLENYNRILKNEWTDHKLLSYDRILDSFSVYLAGKSSLEDFFLARNVNPFDLPSTDHPKQRARVQLLWKRAGTQSQVIYNSAIRSTIEGDSATSTHEVWLLRNASYGHLQLTPELEQAMEEGYRKVQPMQGETFAPYIARRTFFYILRVDKMRTWHSTCTCPYYMQYKTCKHALAWAIHAGHRPPTECDLRQWATGKRKVGRPTKKRKNPLEVDTSIYEPPPADHVSEDEDCLEVELTRTEVYTLLDITDPEVKQAAEAVVRNRAVSTAELFGGLPNMAPSMHLQPPSGDMAPFAAPLSVPLTTEFLGGLPRMPQSVVELET
jgi:hypothetical protein